MKKTLVLVGSVVLAALIAVSCGNKQAEEAAVETEEVVEEVAAEEGVEAEMVEPAAEVIDDAELLSKAQEAGLAKCNCYDPATKTVNPDCLTAILEGAYAKYSKDQKFIDEMDKTYNECVKEKLAAAAKDAAKEGAAKAADALSKKLQK